MGQGEVVAMEPDPGREAEVLGKFLHGIGRELPLGGGSVGKGPLAPKTANGALEGDGWQVVGYRHG